MEIKKLLLKKRKKQGSNSSQISLIFQAKVYAFALQKKMKTDTKKYMPSANKRGKSIF